ncbi:MAG: hypothetical protein KatS3mg087_1772 [Patescibacteria group bacterium]|nr:MAG: hypothetical protein KatS3mg087_1772 [Patescibacteria group bacterium]
MKFYIDWDTNNNFTDSYDDVSDYVISADWELGIADPYSPMCDDSFCTITLRNDDGRFNPENSASPLFGKMLPRRPVRIEHDSDVLFQGYIGVPVSRMRPSGAYTGKTEVVVEGHGYKPFLNTLKPVLQLYENVTTDVIINDVLAQVVLPVSGNPSLDSMASLETGKYTVQAYGDFSDLTAWDVINEMATTEQGRFFFDRDGTVKFYNRHHFILQNSVSGTITGQELVSYDYGYGRYLANRIRATASPRSVGSQESLWELDEPIEIRPNTSIEFEVRLRKQTGQFAGGANLVATPNFSVGNAFVSVVPRGGKALVTVTNTSTSQLARLETLTIEGVPTVQQNIIEVTVEDASSINAYGLTELPMSLGSVVNYSDCASIANYELSRRNILSGDVRSITFLRKIQNNVWNYRIGDKIHLDLSTFNGHQGDYLIIAERHSWNVGDLVQTEYILEPSASNQYWLLGVSGYSELGQTTILAY